MYFQKSFLKTLVGENLLKIDILMATFLENFYFVDVNNFIIKLLHLGNTVAKCLYIIFIVMV